jgi:hypothetical protein
LIGEGPKVLHAIDRQINADSDDGKIVFGVSKLIKRIGG